MAETEKSVTLTINGRQVTAPEATTVIAAAKTLGIEIPHYCYHPSLSVAGSCRLCLVEIEGLPKLALACDTVVREGMAVHTDTAQVADARRGVLEFLLIHHPLDCPVCDRGGECMLHRYVMDHGPGHTRTIEPRLRFRKPQLDPLLDLERNRCIVCTRCVRFMSEIAGDHAIGVYERGEIEYIATFRDTPIRSIFSGTIVDLCPVGAWTNKPFRFKARVWELQQVQSTCPYCAAGCPVTLWMRAGHLHRVTPLTSPEKANFQLSYDGRDMICNLGRFGCDFVNRSDRFRQPRVKREGALVEADWEEALNEVARRLREIREKHGPDAIGFLASSRATCEEMYLFQRLARDVVGTNNVDWRVRAANAEAARAISAAMARSTGRLDELERRDVILVFHADLLAQVPLVALKIKEAARLGSSKVFVFDHHLDGWLSHEAQAVFQYPIEIAEHVLAGLAHRDLASLQRLFARGQDRLDDLLRALGEAKTGLIVFGVNGCSGLFADRWQRGVARLVLSLGTGWETLAVVAERNAVGAFVAGCQPDRLFGGWANDPRQRSGAGERWTSVLPTAPGLSASEMIEAVRNGKLKALYVLGATDFASLPWLGSVLSALQSLELLVVQDVFESPLAERADIVLPGAFFSEKEGTLVNIEGLPASFAKGWSRPEGVQDDAAILDVLAQKMGKNFGYKTAGSVFEEMMRLINPTCPLKEGDLCAPGPGAEWPVRCLNLPKSRAQLNPGTLATVCPTYRPVCRLAAGREQPQVAPTCDEMTAPSVPSGLRLVWSPILRGTDAFGDRSTTMARLRDPEWIEIHPPDAARLGINNGDSVIVEGEGVRASGRACVTENIISGLIYVPENWASLQFETPPSGLPEVRVRRTRTESENNSKDS